MVTIEVDINFISFRCSVPVITYLSLYGILKVFLYNKAYMIMIYLNFGIFYASDDISQF